MKKIIAIVSCLFVAVAANAALIVSSTNAVPGEDIYVAQTSATTTFQTRYLASNNYRSMVQTFEWTSDNPLNAVGLYVLTNAIAAAGQTYVFSIQEITSVVGSSGQHNNTTVGAPFYSETFTISPSTVANGEWLHLDLGSVNLTKGSTYWFVIGPDTNTTVTGSILYIGGTLSSGSDPDNYTGGGATQPTTAASVYYPDGTTVATLDKRDLTFYMISVPEPATAGFFAIAALAIGVTRRCIRKK